MIQSGKDKVAVSIAVAKTKKAEYAEMAEHIPSSKAYEDFKRKPYQAIRNLIHVQGMQMEDKINE